MLTILTAMAIILLLVGIIDITLMFVNHMIEAINKAKFIRLIDEATEMKGE